MNMTKTNMNQTARKVLTAAGLAIAMATPVSAATIADNFVNTVSVVDSCFVVATGVDFGVVTTPMVADIPGVLPNLADTGSISVTVAGETVNVLTVSQAGVNVVCSATPSAITVTLGGGATYNLKDAPVGGTGELAGKMTGPGGAQIDYKIGFAGVQTPTLLNGVTATYAGVFLVNPVTTKIPMQSLTGGAGTYTDVATVTVTY